MNPLKTILPLLLTAARFLPVASAAAPSGAGGLVEPLTDTEAWKRLPRAERGGGQPLPLWARMLARELPRSTAAFLELDLAQRTKSPVDPKLRAAMRWVAAHCNRCAYAEAYAAADARQAGLEEAKLEALVSEECPGWSEADRAALRFARKLTLSSASVTDSEFNALVTAFGEKRTAAIVLLLAYANFQDRFLQCLGATVEPGGPLPPVDVSFDSSGFTVRTTPPPPLQKSSLPRPTGNDLVGDDPKWAEVSFESLQEQLESQRRKPTRLRIPSWDDVARSLPPELAKKSTDIVWYRIVYGYAPELAVPFEIYLRTAGAECAPKYDRIFAGSLFWVVTRAMDCPYCMGHCEMTWEVAGLTRVEIDERSRLLAGDDWSSFSPGEQHAFAFGRKLTTAPWTISHEDIQELKHDFGSDRALIVALNASRYNYMTRISNGFQLRLERDNVFFDYFGVKRPSESIQKPPGS